jgi:hypothetical protein
MSQLSAKSAAEEKDEVLAILRDTKSQLLNAVDSVASDYHEQRTGEGCWSVLQCMEHVVNAEEGMFKLWEKLAEPGSGDHTKDDFVRSRLADRHNKITAPARVVPQGRIKTISEGRERFVIARDTTIRTVEQMPPEQLRNTVVPHPLLTTADLYQLFHIMAMHSGRHATQISETAKQLATRAGGAV